LPLIETDLLKAYLDPRDDLHEASVTAFELLKGPGDYALSSASLLELDLLLKSSGFSGEEREQVFKTLKMRLLKARLVAMGPETMGNAIILQEKYKQSHFYFDSLDLGLAMSHDGGIVSSDEAFDAIQEVERIDPHEL